MAQRTRHDEPGAWHHVYNRGVAKRTLFETRADCRYFLASLARAVRLGWLEVHAYCLLTTHFHLLLRSPAGELWRGMRRSQNAFARRFNRGRKRDGPLFRGRFRSKRVRSPVYFENLVRYIDQNPVSAGLAASAAEYPWGSAHQYARCRGPLWLSRREIECVALRLSGCSDFNGGAYSLAFSAGCSGELSRIIERRLRADDELADPLDELLGAATEQVIEWMRRKAALADGTAPGLVVASPETVQEVVGRRAAMRGAFSVSPCGRQRSAWHLLRAGLLRHLAGVSVMQVAAILGRPRSTMSLWLAAHRRATLDCDEYAQEAAICAAECARRVWQPGLPEWDGAPRAVGV